MRRIALLIAGLCASVPALALDFKSGQRWSCVTDQGAEAYLDVIDVAGKDISFSWGIRDSDSNELISLCNQRDALSADEMSEFCRILGDEFSEGHVMLRKGCAG